MTNTFFLLHFFFSLFSFLIHSLSRSLSSSLSLSLLIWFDPRHVSLFLSSYGLINDRRRDRGAEQGLQDLWGRGLVDRQVQGEGRFKGDIVQGVLKGGQRQAKDGIW